MSLLVLRWDDVRALDPDLVGPKAANLARLLKAGLPIPAFFVVVPDSPGEIEATLAELRSHLDQILAALKSEGADRFAVRSSALAEDRTAGSMAGQFFSATDLGTKEEILDAARACLRSGFTGRVQAAAPAGRAASLPHVNLIIQSSIRARWAGVAFVTRPKADLTSTLIEASENSTDAVTGGSTVSERLIVTSGKARLPIAVGVAEAQPVPPPEGRQAPDWLALHALGRKAETVLRLAPLALDMEWAWDGSKLWLLQARPGQPPPLPAWLTRPSETIWTSFFFAERFSRPVSPLGWDVLRPAVEKRAFREPLVYLGYQKLARDPLTRLVNGRPYTRWTVFRRLHELLSPEFLHAEKRLTFYPDGLPNLGWLKRSSRLLRAWLRVVEDPDWLPWANLRRWRKFVPEYTRKVRALSADIEQHDHAEALLYDLERAENLSRALLALHRWSLTFAELLLRLLSWLLEFGLGLETSDSHQLAVDLLRGLPGNLTTEMNVALSGLSHLPESRGKAELETFLQKFGHRSPSLDIAEPPWREQPDQLLTMAGTFPKPGPQSREERRRGSLVQDVLTRCRLPQPLRWLWTELFHWTLKLAEPFALLRENQRHYWHLVLEQKRRAALKLGEILVRRGVMRSPELVFELRRQELARLALGFGFLSRADDILKWRREKRLAQTRLPTPLLWDETEESGADVHAARPDTILRGLGVSPGKASGRVVLAMGSDLPEVPPGSVLVLGGLDPGWTPLLGRLAALVTEVGGALSHGAILAREFGVPAVAAVSGARHRLRNGDLVEVDGSAGVVRVLERA